MLPRFYPGLLDMPPAAGREVGVTQMPEICLCLWAPCTQPKPLQDKMMLVESRCIWLQGLGDRCRCGERRRETADRPETIIRPRLPDLCALTPALSLSTLLCREEQATGRGDGKHTLMSGGRAEGSCLCPEVEPTVPAFSIVLGLITESKETG